MKYYSAKKKLKFLPFATTWMGLEGIMPGEISHKKKRHPYWKRISKTGTICTWYDTIHRKP